jgi:hypothetical protein
VKPHHKQPTLRDQFYLAAIEFFKSHIAPPKVQFIRRTFIIGPGALFPKGTEPPMPDFSGGQIPNTFNAHFPTIYQDQDGASITPDPLTFESTTPDVASVTPDADPTAGFTVMTVDGSVGPGQIKITYGDADAAPGKQTAVAFLNFEVTSEKFVSSLVIGAAELIPK